MFAFAIWDARKKRLFIARDPLGIKPLYYWNSEKHFLFASEIRTLLGTGLVPRKLDRAGVVNFLTFGSVCDPNTAVEGVRALGPGQFLVWENGRIRTTVYWDLAGNSQSQGTISRGRLQDDMTEVLLESLRLNMVSDVPVGVFLSGGIDSSVIVGLLSQCGFRLNTFSLVFREAEYSEAEYSRAVAQRFGTEHREISVSQRDALDAIPGALQSMDQPTIDGVNTYFISRQTRAAGVKVALSGLGGDEFFGGYSSFHTVPRMERFVDQWNRIPAVMRPALANAFRMLAKDTDQNRKLFALARDNGRLMHPYFLSRMLFTPGQQHDLLAIGDPAACDAANAPMRETLEHARSLDPINRVSYLEARCYMLNTLLRDSDSMSMAHGLEVRVPLIDHILAERTLRFPGSWKLDESTPKPLLVNSLKGALPSEVVHRRKQGFTLPFEHWMRQELRPAIESGIGKVATGPLKTILKAESAHRIWQDFLLGKTSWSRPWALYVLQSWCDLHSVSA
jgi:asparagine synthase (glutamine-hydrolysing)